MTKNVIEVNLNCDSTNSGQHELNLVNFTISDCYCLDISKMQMEFSQMQGGIERLMMQAQNAEKQAKEIIPFPRPHKNRSERILAAMMQRAKSKEISGNFEMLQTFVTANKHSSKVTDWSTLKPVFLKDMTRSRPRTSSKR